MDSTTEYSRTRRSGYVLWHANLGNFSVVLQIKQKI